MQPTRDVNVREVQLARLQFASANWESPAADEHYRAKKAPRLLRIPTMLALPPVAMNHFQQT